MPGHGYLGTLPGSLSQGLTLHVGADARERRSLAAAAAGSEDRRASRPAQELQRRSGAELPRLQEVPHVSQGRRSRGGTAAEIGGLPAMYTCNLEKCSERNILYLRGCTHNRAPMYSS